MAANKMGRPPKPKAERKAETLTLRLTKGERKDAEAAAEREELPGPSWRGGLSLPR